jgi:hypothetical protein
MSKPNIKLSKNNIINLLLACSSSTVTIFSQKTAAELNSLKYKLNKGLEVKNQN